MVSDSMKYTEYRKAFLNAKENLSIPDKSSCLKIIYEKSF